MKLFLLNCQKFEGYECSNFVRLGCRCAMLCAVLLPQFIDYDRWASITYIYIYSVYICASAACRIAIEIIVC